MRRAARARDDNLDAAPFGLLGKLEKQIRRPVRRDDSRFVRDIEILQNIRRISHRFPIGRAAHYDGDQRIFIIFHCLQNKKDARRKQIRAAHLF
jgi:hypothetical protein